MLEIFFIENDQIKKVKSQAVYDPFTKQCVNKFFKIDLIL